MGRKNTFCFILIVLAIILLIFLFLVVPRAREILFFKSEKLDGRGLGCYLSKNINDTRTKIVYLPGEYVPINELPSYLPQALVAIEDKRFYSHIGIDFFSIFRALYLDFECKCLRQGGSSITQQLARNIYLGPEKTFSRKFKESIIALKIETVYPKNQILEFYLNYVYFGDELILNKNYSEPMFGIQQASKFYFNKSAENLTLAESTLLVATLQNPLRLSPILNISAVKSRQRLILVEMLKQNYITKEQMDAALIENLSFVIHDQGDQYVKELISNNLRWNPFSGDESYRQNNQKSPIEYS